MNPMPADTRSFAVDPADAQRRREPRFRPAQAPRRPLAVRAAGWAADCPVDALRNVSAGGASLLLGAGPAVGEALSLVLDQGEVELAFAGRVAWCRPADATERTEAGVAADRPAFVIGLQLHGPGSLLAMLDGPWAEPGPA